MTPSEAFAAVALVAVGCDGNLGQEEARALRHQLEGRHPYRELSDEAMGQLFDGLLAQLREQGWRPMLRRAIAALSPPQQETALAVAVHLVLSDRQLGEEEQQLLEELAALITLPRERSHTIIDAIRVLNRDSLAT